MSAEAENEDGVHGLVVRRARVDKGILGIHVKNISELSTRQMTNMRRQRSRILL